MKNKWQQLITENYFIDISEIIKTPAETILREIEQCENYFVEARNTHEYDNLDTELKYGQPLIDVVKRDWSVYSLFSKSGHTNDTIVQGLTGCFDKQSIIESYRNIRNHKWTHASTLMPKTTQWLKSSVVPYIEPAYIRIGKLDSGGLIPPHKDFEDKVLPERYNVHTYNALSVLFITISDSPNCKFVCNKKELNTYQGSAYLLSQSVEHYTTNFDEEPRYNLRVHGMFTNLLRKTLLG